MVRGLRLTAIGLTLSLAAVPGIGAAPAGVLPDHFDRGAGGVREGRRPWTVVDIVEIRRIVDVAVSDQEEIAFVLQAPSLEQGEIAYGLYVIAREYGPARKILGAPFIDQLSWHALTRSWTVRADLGEGVQVYAVNAAGETRAVVKNSETIVVGAYQSVIEGSASEGPRPIGVYSYEWSSDGRMLWYSKFRLRSPADRRLTENDGVRFDDSLMTAHVFQNEPTAVLGAELHVFIPDSGKDRTLVFAPAGANAGTFFDRGLGSASWDSGGEYIQYLVRNTNSAGQADIALWRINAMSGEAEKLPANSLQELFSAVPAPNGSGYFQIRQVGQSRHLIRVSYASHAEEDLGEVPYLAISKGRSGGPWLDSGEATLLPVRYSDRDGLVRLPSNDASRKLAAIKDSLTHCAFTRGAEYGACVRESQTRAPELVSVRLKAGAVETLVNPNARYEEISTLRVEPRTWKTRYGTANTGFVTYPRGYRAGERRPTIVVTHANDARNNFAAADFQWEFPIQVFAEAGFVVLSVNEPAEKQDDGSSHDARFGLSGGEQGTVQFGQILNAVAGVEAAARWAINEGLAVPDAIGIAGYSRGAEVTEYAMTQSNMFSAAVEGDAGGFTAGQYWAGGWAPFRKMYQQIYGGSPYDAKALGNYLRLSPSFRAPQFAGPLLQLFTQANGLNALELHALLQDQKIPTELVFFPNENHIFWHPRRRAAAMNRSLEWFSFWLKGEKPASQEVAERWNAMRTEWTRGREARK